MRLWVSSYLTGTASSISVSFIARFGPEQRRAPDASDCYKAWRTTEKGKNIEDFSFPPSPALKFTSSIRCKLFNLLWQWEVFWFLSPSHFWIRKFSVSFFYEKYPSLGSEMWKIKLQKIVGNLLGKLRKLYMNGTVIQEFLAVLKLENSRQHLILRTEFAILFSIVLVDDRSTC